MNAPVFPGPSFVKWSPTADEVKELKVLMDRNPPMNIQLFDAPKPRHPPEAEQLYLQNHLVINGNTAMWMTKDFDGYTADVRKAHIFTRAEAAALELTGHSLQLWPKAQIDQLTRPTVSLAELGKATT